MSHLGTIIRALTVAPLALVLLLATLAAAQATPAPAANATNASAADQAGVCTLRYLDSSLLGAAGSLDPEGTRKLFSTVLGQLSPEVLVRLKGQKISVRVSLRKPVPEPADTSFDSFHIESPVDRQTIQRWRGQNPFFRVLAADRSGVSACSYATSGPCPNVKGQLVPRNGGYEARIDALGWNPGCCTVTMACADRYGNKAQGSRTFGYAHSPYGFGNDCRPGAQPAAPAPTPSGPECLAYSDPRSFTCVYNSGEFTKSYRNGCFMPVVPSDPPRLFGCIAYWDCARWGGGALCGKPSP
jgi:hypothetical protein